MKVGNLQRPMSLFSFLSSHVISMVHTFKWHLLSSFLWCDTLLSRSPCAFKIGCNISRDVVTSYRPKIEDDIAIVQAR